MHLFFASDFGNLYTYVVGVPLFSLSFVVGAICLYNRWRAVAIFFGVTCLLAAAILYLLVPHSGRDETATAVVAGLLFVLGTVLVVTKRQNDHDDDAAL